jgi:AcrR family transcriptional regulator
VGRNKIIEDGQLLAKARDIFMREGIAVGSRRIAQEIGISSSVLFQRFGSKEELFFAAMKPPAPDLAGLLTRDDSAASPAVWMERIAAGLLDYFRQLGPVLASLSSHPAFDYPTFAKRHPASSLEAVIGELVKAMAARHQDGEIDCPDPGPAVLNLVAVAYALAMFERMGVHGGQFNQSTVQAVSRVLWHGVAPPDRRGPPSSAESPAEWKGHPE